MLIKLLILVKFSSSNMLNQTEYAVAVLQSKHSQHLHKNLRYVILLCFLITTCVCDKEDLFIFLNVQIYSGLKLCLLKNCSFICLYKKEYIPPEFIKNLYISSLKFA